VTARERYLTPASFGRALTDMLRAAAKQGRWSSHQLQRQVAYDRLIERLYSIDEGWIIKGATALLARNIGARGTLDIDVYRELSREAAEEELRRAADTDLGDWFRFEIGVGVPTNRAARLPVNALVGSTTWVEFHVDLVGPDLRMTSQPEDVPPLALGLIPCVEQRGYRAYPLVDHVADKIAAMYERHGDEHRPSTRYRDLVDLVAIVTAESVRADLQLAALRSEFDRRRLDLPDHFAAPDSALWEPGYAAEARRSSLKIARALDEALAVVRPFVDPLLDNTAKGIWEPAPLAWMGSD
jgi:hypothetical protein